MIKKWGAREKKRSIMNSNEKCVTALQALWNVTYAHVRRGFALSLEEEDDGLYSWDTTPLLQQPWVATPSGHQLCCFPPEITSKESPTFLFQGWLIDGFGTENMASVEDGCWFLDRLIIETVQNFMTGPCIFWNRLIETVVLYFWNNWTFEKITIGQSQNSATAPNCVVVYKSIIYKFGRYSIWYLIVSMRLNYI